MNFFMIQKSMESDVKARFWRNEANAHSNPFSNRFLPVSNFQRFDGESESIRVLVFATTFERFGNFKSGFSFKFYVRICTPTDGGSARIVSGAPC